MTVETAPDVEARGRILVVEDDRSSRSALVALLRLSGFEAWPAATVSEALARLAESPSCLILDLMLPDGNGGSILSYIRERDLPIRVVVTTGAIEWEKMLKASPSPPDMILQKPVNYRELIDWLQIHCRTR